MFVGKLADSFAISFGVWQNNRQPHSIVNTLLEKLAGQPATKIEEFPRQITRGDNETFRLNASGDRFRDVPERSNGDT